MLPTATAKINGTVIAQSDIYETVEGNIYVCFLRCVLDMGEMANVGRAAVSAIVSTLLCRRNRAELTRSSAVNREFLEPSDTVTTCAWKGRAAYYNVNVDGELHSALAYTGRYTVYRAVCRVLHWAGYWAGYWPSIPGRIPAPYAGRYTGLHNTHRPVLSIPASSTAC
jgi:Domain of unknown function (DUF427)